MRSVAYVRLLALGALATSAGCGQTMDPKDPGYPSAKAKPWTKPKVMKIDAKGNAKADGDLSYPDHHRAIWYAFDTPANGQLDVALEVTPPADNANEDFDLGLEVYDPNLKVIAKADLDDTDAKDNEKKRTIVDLLPGRYLIHLYLENRIDTADYSLRVAWKPTAAIEKSDFPAHVAMLGVLPAVGTDDTPKGAALPPPPPIVVVPPKHPPKQTPPPPPPPTQPPPAIALTARIVGVETADKGTRITIARGTSNGAAVGMRFTINGMGTGGQLGSCNEAACTALINLPVEKLSGAKSVSLQQ